MDFDNENENFYKLCTIVVEVNPDFLRKYFVQKWNEKFPQEQWESGADCGEILINKIKAKNKKRKKLSFVEKNLQEGNEMDWDTTALMHALEHRKLGLIHGNERRHLDTLRMCRNEIYAHTRAVKVSSDKFSQKIDTIKEAAKYLFGEAAENEIDKVVKSTITSQSNEQMKEHLEKEKARYKEYLADMKGK